MKGENKYSYLSMENVEDFIVKNADQFPTRLTCYIKLKVINKADIKFNSIKGSGMLIAPNLLLTSAHNYQTIIPTLERYKKENKEVAVITIVKQAMVNKKEQRMYKVVKWHVSSKYNPSKDKTQNFISDLHDFALCQLEPMDKVGDIVVEEKQFVPIVALDQQEISEIEEIKICGFPAEINKRLHKNNDDSCMLNQSSRYMANMFEAKGSVGFQDSAFKYTLPTDQGVSGAAIIATWRGSPIIIGIHKGKEKKKEDFPQKELMNMGVSAMNMIEEVNSWTMKILGKQLIFTPRTLKLRDGLPENKTLLHLLNKKLRSDDILVLTGAKIDHIQQITLSGNLIGDQGVKFLLAHPLLNIKVLMLTDNRLTVVPPEIVNIPNIQTLSLSVNRLKDLPKEMKQLTKLTKLWLTYNLFTVIPEVLLNLAKPGVFFQLYENKFDQQSQPNLSRISQLKQSKAEISWKHLIKESNPENSIKQNKNAFQKKPIQ